MTKYKCLSAPALNNCNTTKQQSDTMNELRFGAHLHAIIQQSSRGLEAAVVFLLLRQKTHTFFYVFIINENKVPSLPKTLYNKSCEPGNKE